MLVGALKPLTIALAQQIPPSASAQARTQAIAASFNKSKRVIKEKRGVRAEKYEPAGPDLSVRRSFTLRNGRIDGALLTATQIYANGTQNRFEGAFMNRTSFDSPTDNGFTVFGLGVIGKDVAVGGLTINRFFYELQR